MSGYYPPGTDAGDPRAPWNDDGGEPCSECDGEKRATCPTCNGARYLADGATCGTCDDGEDDGKVPCAHCDETGLEPTRAELRWRREQLRADVERDRRKDDAAEARGDGRWP